MKGTFTALITPFDKFGKLDEKGLKKLIQYQIRSNIDGIVFLGTTGEAPTLTAQEKIRIMEIAQEEAKGKVHISFGCGAYATHTTIEQAKLCEKLGADSLLIVTPYYNRPTQEGIFQHFQAVHNEVSLPICVYNIASRTGQNIETQTLVRLIELPRIMAVKEASGNIIQMMDVIDKLAMRKKGFSVLSGDDSFTLPLMGVGGHGVISVISNLFPKTFKKLVDNAPHNMRESQRINYLLKPLIAACGIETNPIPIKYMVGKAGLPAGPCRLPLTSLLPQNQAKVDEILQAHQSLLQEELEELVETFV